MTEMRERIARVLDSPSVFMGGASRQSTKKAEAVLKAMMEPTDDMWGGLARAIVMWMDMEPKTPRALFRHLESSGETIPQWLRDEPELQALDHVPSKGTRAVIIHKAMIQAALGENTDG